LFLLPLAVHEEEENVRCPSSSLPQLAVHEEENVIECPSSCLPQLAEHEEEMVELFEENAARLKAKKEKAEREKERERERQKEADERKRRKHDDERCGHACRPSDGSSLSVDLSVLPSAGHAACFVRLSSHPCG
jgi:hypothetical protein